MLPCLVRQQHVIAVTQVGQIKSCPRSIFRHEAKPNVKEMANSIGVRFDVGVSWQPDATSHMMMMKAFFVNALSQSFWLKVIMSSLRDSLVIS